MELVLDARRVARWMFTVVALLFLAHIGVLILRDVLGRDYVFGFVRQFDVNVEANTPTWYSSMALLFCATLLSLIAAVKVRERNPFARHWIGLTVIFAFLSCDEVAQIHEQLVQPLGALVTNPFLKYIAWVVVYTPLVVVFLVAYLKFFLALGVPDRKRFLLAGATYVMGVLGMEFITGAYGRLVPTRPLHWMFSMTEELLEMSGVVLFAYALLQYIAHQLPEVRVRVKPHGSDTAG